MKCTQIPVPMLMVDPRPIKFFAEPLPTAIEVPVLKVFDGDGFLTKIDLRQLTGNSKDHAEKEAVIRLGFVDAPELQQRGGVEAREFLTALIGGRSVFIDILIKSDTNKIVDRYGRVVAVPYLADRSPASMFSNRRRRNIEIEMLLNGWAWLLERYEPDEIYFQALGDAQRNKRGIWAYEDNIHPWDFKRQKGNARLILEQSITVGNCPAEGCGGSLVKRNGKFGAFHGCSRYPKCTYSRNI